MLLKRAIFGVLALVVAVFIFILYNTYDAGRRLHAGADQAVSGSRTAAAEDRVRTVPNEPAAATPEARVGVAESQPAEVAGAALSGPGPQILPGGSNAVTRGDSLHAQPPNGITFAGKGPYQLYRQGDLTWRLNTETGATCVIFATEAEWRKPEVYRSGCRGR